MFCQIVSAVNPMVARFFFSKQDVNVGAGQHKKKSLSFRFLLCIAMLTCVIDHSIAPVADTHTVSAFPAYRYSCTLPHVAVVVLLTFTSVIAT
jgi:hypothetical protein